jgi:hypothetical protein
MKRSALVLSFLLAMFLAGNLFAGNAARFYSPDLDTAINNEENAKRFNIGGHLFAGTNPINNPESTGDTGFVYLYRIVNNYVIPIDTTIVTTFGYYTFSNVLQGEYILKAGLTYGSSRYKAFFPTYFFNSLKWSTSEHLLLTDSNKFELNIHLEETVDTLSGPASMSGFVMQTLKDPGYQKVDNTEIILLDGNKSPLIFSYSDKNGNFAINNLPYGTYYLFVESTGKFPNLLRVILDANHPTFDSLMLEVLSHAPTSIQEIIDPTMIEAVSAFPNPTNEQFNIVLRSNEPQSISLELFTLNGQRVYKTSFEVNGFKSISVPTHQLSNGYYSIVLRSQDGKWTQLQKILKN